MAGYRIYSVDWDEFQKFVMHPSDKQLLAFTKWISEGRGGDDDESEDDDEFQEDDELEDEDDDELDGGEAVRDWPTEPEELRVLVKERLALDDWYGDLSDGARQDWETAVNYFCSEGANGVGFRVDHDGVYWDVIDLARKQFKVAANQISPDVALSAFGQRPYRYFPTASESNSMDDDYDFDAWQPTHSMHTPDEVRKMLEELESVASAIEASKDQQAIHDYDALVGVLEQLAEEKRMLFIQVDT